MALSPQFLLPSVPPPLRDPIPSLNPELLPGEHTQVSPPVLTPPLGRPWGTLGSPAPPLPCPAAWPLYGLGASPALGHSPHPCRLSAHLRHQHCSLVCFTSAVIRVAFVRLHPEALRSFQKVQEVTPLCPEPSHRPVRATQPYAPPHPSAPAPAFVSLMVLSALVFVTLLHVFSRRRQAP